MRPAGPLKAAVHAYFKRALQSGYTERNTVCVDLHLDQRAWHRPFPATLPRMTFSRAKSPKNHHHWLDEMVQVWRPGNNAPAGGSGVGHDLLDSFFRCAEHLRDGLEIAQGDAWAAGHRKEAGKFARKMRGAGRAAGHLGGGRKFGAELPPKEDRYMFIVATDAPQTAVERMSRRLQHRGTDRVSMFGPQLRGLQAHVSAAMAGGKDPWWAERLVQFFVFARCRHSILTRNSADIRVAVETGAAWRHHGSGPTLSEVALDYQVDTATGAWRNFSLAVKVRRCRLTL